MTLEEIRNLVVSADPEAEHYESSTEARCYTVWYETAELPFAGDDIHDEGWRFTVMRFTDQEYDETNERIRRALREDPRTAYRHEVEFIHEAGLIRHTYTCEGA